MLQCPCKHHTCLHWDWGHILGCHGLTYLRTSRHDTIVAHVAACLKELRPQGRLKLTPTIPVPGAPHTMADISFQDGPNTYVIDVTCTNPTSFSAIENERFSTVYYPDAASDMGHERKQQQYARNLAQRPDVQAQCVAIVVDTTGRMGTQGRAFFATVGAHDPGAVAVLRARIAQTAVVHAGRMLMEGMQRERTERGVAVRMCNPAIPAPPAAEGYDRWIVANSKLRARRQQGQRRNAPPIPHDPQPPPPHSPSQLSDYPLTPQGSREGDDRDEQSPRQQSSPTPPPTPPTATTEHTQENSQRYSLRSSSTREGRERVK